LHNIAKTTKTTRQIEDLTRRCAEILATPKLMSWGSYGINCTIQREILDRDYKAAIETLNPGAAPRSPGGRSYVKRGIVRYELAIQRKT